MTTNGRVFVASRAKGARGFRWDAHGGPGLELDDVAAELRLRPPGDEEVHLLLHPVAVSSRWTPARGKAFEGDGEVAELQCLTKHADLEILGIHSNLGSHARHLGDPNDGVSAIGSSSFRKYRGLWSAHRASEAISFTMEEVSYARA
jgi:hypothetical protein